MEDPPPLINGPIPYLAGVGYVCQQFALVELHLLSLIAAAEKLSLEQVHTRYGTTDMMPRLRMTRRLIEEGKWPPRLQHRFKAVMNALQKEGSKGLVERRNLFIHGAVKPGPDKGTVTLLMPRWPRGDREQVVGPLDAVQLGNRLGELATELNAIFREYGRWKYAVEFEDYSHEQIGKAETRSRLIRAQQIKRGLKLVWANLKPF